MEILKNFCSIDFETMTPKRTSACSVGLAKVRDGKVIETYHSFIKPIPDDSKRTNSIYNGITLEMVEDAPTFPEIWKEIKEMIDSFPLVAHNFEFDKSVLSKLLEYHKLDDPNNFEFQCTYALTDLNLELACQVYDVELKRHHNAKNDALACAELYLAIANKTPDKFISVDIVRKAESKERKRHRTYDKSTLEKLDETLVEDKSTPFFNKKVVVTGVFLNYPDRNELGIKLKNLGADICTSISSKTNIVVMGANAGPAKQKKIEELNSKGYDIKVIHEAELKNILDNCNFGDIKEEIDPFIDATVLINGCFNSFKTTKNLVRILHLLKVKSVKFDRYDDIDIVLSGDNPRQEAITAIMYKLFDGEKIQNFTEEKFIDYLKNFHPDIAEENNLE